jgi:hypothetical protein
VAQRGKTFVFRTGSADGATLEDGIAAIFNAHTDRRAVLDVRRVRLLPTSGQAAFGCGTLKLCRISALSGGEDVYIRKHDTGSADLPAEVLVRAVADSVTTSDTLRTIGEIPVFNSLLAGGSIGARVPSRPLGSARTQTDDLMRFPTSSDVERIVLREGEGLSICEGAFGVPRAGAAGFCVRNTSSGACYTVRSRDIRRRGSPGLSHLAIFNGSGSGVILEVFSVQYPEEGEATIPLVRLAKISGYVGGVDASENILKLDTQATIPSTVKALGGPFRAQLMGEDSGTTIDWHSRHGVDGLNVLQQQNIGVFRRLTSPVISTDAESPLLYSFANSLVWQSSGANEGIILRPGEGLAVLAGRAGVVDNSTMNCYQVEMLFNYIPPAPNFYNVME